MKKKYRQSQHGKLPMVELIVTIGLFAIISVFLLEMFLAANSLQHKAKDKGKAITISESVAESIKGAESFEEARAALGLATMWAEVKERDHGNYRVQNIGDTERQGATKIYSLQYDEEWRIVEEAGTYSLLVIPYEEELDGRRIENYELYIYRLKGYPSMLHTEDNVELFQLDVSKYRPE